ncbi:MAG TPA: glycolate oxidase, partial [Syntrophomonas sp.]|nr:glycolate oxidase [Syntrophomonas sp.]
MDFKKLPPVQEQIMKCVRCGKCRSVCPVFAEIRNETAAPRGHVFMVQMLRDGKVEPHQEVYDHLAKCLLCETCSVNCPSGIDVHELNAAARSYISVSYTHL